MPRPSAGRAATVAALVAIVALGAALRLIPGWRGADPDLPSDPAFHLRMTRAVVERGRTPRVDPLAGAPSGREVERLLPTGLYPVAAGFHRLAAALDQRDLETHVRWFTALAGALIALPVYAATRALHPGRAPALAAALVAVTLPAHLHRSVGHWFRYEALGTLLLTTHVAAALAALAARSRRVARVAATGSAAALLAALAVWRVAFMFPVLETAFVLVFALLRPPGTALREWFTAQVAAVLLACLAFGYLREQSFALSTGGLLAMGLAAALWTPWLRREAAPRAARAGAVAAVALAAAALGALAGRERQYAQVLEAARRKLSATLGVASAPPDPMTRLALSVEELQGGSPGSLLGAGELSWLGVAFVAAPLAWWLARRPRGGVAALAPAPALLAFLAAALTAVTLLFTRNKIVLAPLAAVVIGSLVAALTAPAPAAPQAAPRRRGAARPMGTLRPALLALLALAFVLTARDALTLALTRTSRLEPGLAAALAWLARETPPDATVLAPWQHGYEIQTYAGRRTLVDGLLEDPLTRGRIVAHARAWLEQRPDSLAALCARAGAGHLLVPPSTALYGIALLTDWPAAARVRAGLPLRRDEADRVLVRMMVLGESPPPFEPAFESGGWRVYRLRR